MFNPKSLLLYCAALLFTLTAAAESVVTAPTQAGFGVVERCDAPRREVVIDGTRFRVDVTTQVGQVIAWPGKYWEVPLDTLQKGDQVFFDADFSQKPPYKLKYIHRLMK
jgi:hypothetical protein